MRLGPELVDAVWVNVEEVKTTFAGGAAEMVYDAPVAFCNVGFESVPVTK